MKVVPIIKCRNMAKSLDFYTKILDFELKYPDSITDPVINLVNGDAEIQLSTMRGDSLFGCAVNVYVDDVDTLFAKYVSRGLDTSGNRRSPVHQGPLNQTWGTREFYVDDPNGNTLRFAMDME